MDFLEEKEVKANKDGVNQMNVSVFLALLSFFIVLNFISTNNDNKSSNLKQSLKQEFKQKKLSEEFTNIRRDYETSFGDASYNFKDVINNFLDTQKNIVEVNLKESKSHYLLDIDINRFFGSENNIRRVGAENFIKNLNSLLSNNRLRDTSKAKVVLFAEAENKYDIAAKGAKLKNLQKSIDNTDPYIQFSLAILPEDKANINFNTIQILFGKNEF